MKTPSVLKSLAIMIALPALVACEQAEVSGFAANVKPVLDANCLECHRPGGAGFLASGLDMTSYESLMQGATSGPMVIPGDSMGSNLLVLMEGRADPSISMPHGSHKKVSQGEIEKIRLWIDQGALNN